MKTFLVLVALIVGLTIVAAPAPASGAGKAAPPTAAQFAALSKKVTTLQKQVTKLQKQEKTLESAANAAFAYAVCLTAATADAFQGTWIFVDKAATVFPSTSTGGSAINDLQACNAFSIARQLPSTDTAPNTAIFSALTNIFTSASLFSSATIFSK